MDDDDFDDLLAGVEQIEGSSQEPLTTAATNLDFCDHDRNEIDDRRSTPAASVNSRDTDAAHYQDNKSHCRALCCDVLQSDSLPEAKNPSDICSSEGRPALNVLEKIEAVFEGIADALINETEGLAIELRVRATQPAKTRSYEDEDKKRRIRFPGKTAEEAWRFTVVTRILELIHEALRNGIVLSKRDIYYRDPALFGTQARVDRYVDEIALTFDVPRSMLNVTAAARSLVAGAIKLCRRDGSFVNAGIDREGILVSSLRDFFSVNMSAVQWILVIEKEATFRSIAASSFWEMLSRHGVIITGKGYPDIASRALLHFLATPSPRNSFSLPQVFGLVDFDPDGLAIFSIYKNGSLARAHENQELRVPHLQWLGLRSEHIMRGGDDVHASQGILSLTARDRRKAVKMLERSVSSDGSDIDFQARQALQVMLVFNTKAELQLLDSVPCGMASLLSNRLGNI